MMLYNRKRTARQSYDMPGKIISKQLRSNSMQINSVPAFYTSA